MAMTASAGRWVWGALGALALLAGCSNEAAVESGGVFTELRRAATGLIEGRAATGEGVTLSDAQLNAAPVDIVLLEIPEFGSDVGLVRQAVNRDVETWVTPEGYAVQLKGGQIVGTAGFGFDLSSAAVPDFKDAPRRTIRDHYRLQGDETVARTRYFCDVTYRPGQEIVVTSRRFTAIRIDESCESTAGERIANRYFVDGRGVIRQSRQFVSPRLGYFELADVHRGLR